MRAVMLEAPAELLAERRRKGHDLRDEVWNGVLHMPPPPSRRLQHLGARLVEVLAPIARAAGLEGYYETGLYRPGAGEADYRVPDLSFALPAQGIEQGLAGAELVIEILSPGDESYDKLPFYGEVGVREALLVQPGSLTIEMFVLRGGAMHAVVPDDRGAVRSLVLGVELRTVPGPKLELCWSGGRIEL
jgi:Uma2 family endonuclease